ncbi:hypothetical protein [Zobellia laminariae]|uniref:hypothetical protein n=1 Tax=Zobellia laminariae TaxID=248906 RepID=UPI0026F44862|nr:hypothetical protein [Zobellia laminariae]WKX76344.1 hypothetical protein Q5W13_22820 [Zobellia laminariae]
MEGSHSKLAKNSHTYLYHQLKEAFVNVDRFRDTIMEEQPLFKYGNSQERIPFDDVLKSVKNDLEPFFKSIFNINKFSDYVNSNNIHEPSICNALRKEYVYFIYEMTNTIAKDLNDFKKGNHEFYASFSNFEKGMSRNLIHFIFNNSQFTGNDEYYESSSDSNQFIKEYLTSILIETRENPKAISSRLLILEINRVQTMILKNANFNFLHWYLNELKSAMNDLKFVHDTRLNYGLKCSEKLLRNLYRKLKSEDFIDIDHTTETNFIEVFIEDWYTHDSICVLKMDNPQTNYFLNQFKINIDASIKVSDIEKVKNIRNKNGYIRSASLSASSSRNKKIGPKKEAELVTLFVKL